MTTTLEVPIRSCMSKGERPGIGAWRDVFPGIRQVTRVWVLLLMGVLWHSPSRATPLQYCSNDAPKTIPDVSTITSELHISVPGEILDLDVQVTIRHGWDQDLDVFLIGPDGTRVELFTDVGGSGDDFETTLDDEAPQPITAGSAPFAGRYRPEGRLGDFDGKDMQGTWTLEITDDEFIFSGTLESWCLLVQTEIFQDKFLSTTINSDNWPVAVGATVDDRGINEPSPPYSLRLNGNPSGGDQIQSREIDLSPFSCAALVYWYQRTGNGNSPETGEDLIVDYWDGAQWIELKRHPGNGPDMTNYEQVTVALPSEALHRQFRFRMHNSGNTGAYDDWFVDDVRIVTPIFHEAFPSTTIDPNNWPVVAGATVDDKGMNEPSPPYSLRLNGDPSGGDSIESRCIDLSHCSNATLTYNYQCTGNGDSPETGDDLIVDYWDGAQWIELKRHPGNGPDMTHYEPNLIPLPPEAMHEQFWFRIRNTAATGAYDDWFVDDVTICTPPPPFRLLGATGGEGRNPFSLVELQTDPEKEVLRGESRYNPGLDFDGNGILYGASGELRVVDPTDGSCAPIVSIGMLMRSIAFHPNGSLYGTESATGDLYLIDPMTGQATLIWELPVTVWGIDFAPDGTLYGAFLDLYSFDLDSGTYEKIGDLNGHSIWDIDYAPDGYIYGVDERMMYKIDPDPASGAPIVVKEYGPYDTVIRGVASELTELANLHPMASLALFSTSEDLLRPTSESIADLDNMIQDEQTLKAAHQLASEGQAR